MTGQPQTTSPRQQRLSPEVTLSMCPKVRDAARGFASHKKACTQCRIHAMNTLLDRAARGKFGNRNPSVVSYSCAVLIRLTSKPRVSAWFRELSDNPKGQKGNGARRLTRLTLDWTQGNRRPCCISKTYVDSGTISIDICHRDMLRIATDVEIQAFSIFITV